MSDSPICTKCGERTDCSTAKHVCPDKYHTTRPIILPTDIMDYLAKSAAWLHEMIDNSDDKIRERLKKQANNLLDKYDYNLLMKSHEPQSQKTP